MWTLTRIKIQLQNKIAEVEYMPGNLQLEEKVEYKMKEFGDK